MAIEPEKGGKLAHERLQSALPVRAKTRRQPSRLMGPQGCSAGATPGRSQRPLFLYRGGHSGARTPAETLLGKLSSISQTKIKRRIKEYASSQNRQIRLSSKPQFFGNRSERSLHLEAILRDKITVYRRHRAAEEAGQPQQEAGPIRKRQIPELSRVPLFVCACRS